MNIEQAKTSIKNLQVEASKLNNSALVELFEINLSNIADQRGIILDEKDRIFCFHNQVKLLDSKITFNGRQYIAAPIQAEGFDKSSQGVLPTPILRMVVNSDAIPLLALLKQQIRLFGDLVGALFVRKRTFAAFLNISNFNDNNKPTSVRTDEYSEMPADVYFINRKLRENKLIIEYELASILDVEGVNLPRRTMISKRCNFNYRGEGCNYDSQRDDNIHGEFTRMPSFAPPIATEEDKIITEILGINSLGTDKGKFIQGNNTSFNIGDYCYIEMPVPAGSNTSSLTRGIIKYYFVARRAGVLNPPPNVNDWIADKCSKCIHACKLRWDSDVPNYGDLTKGHLPFGGFPSLERLRSNQ